MKMSPTHKGGGRTQSLSFTLFQNCTSSPAPKVRGCWITAESSEVSFITGSVASKMLSTKAMHAVDPIAERQGRRPRQIVAVDVFGLAAVEDLGLQESDIAEQLELRHRQPFRADLPAEGA